MREEVAAAANETMNRVWQGWGAEAICGVLNEVAGGHRGTQTEHMGDGKRWSKETEMSSKQKYATEQNMRDSSAQSLD